MAKTKRKPVTGTIYFDYKDVKTLQRYVNQFGQIEVRKRTGLTEMQQRRLAKASSLQLNTYKLTSENLWHSA